MLFLDGHNEANVPNRIRDRLLKEFKFSARQLKGSGSAK